MGDAGSGCGVSKNEENIFEIVCTRPGGPCVVGAWDWKLERDGKHGIFYYSESPSRSFVVFSPPACRIFYMPVAKKTKKDRDGDSLRAITVATGRRVVAPGILRQ